MNRQPSLPGYRVKQEWLDKGLVFLFDGKTRCDVVTGLPLTLVGTNPSNTAVTAGTEGPNFTGTTNPAYFTAGGQNDYNITGEITIIARLKITNKTGTNNLIAKVGAFDNQNSLGVPFWVDFQDYLGKYSLAFYRSQNEASAYFTTKTTDLQINTPYTIGAMASGDLSSSDYDCYINDMVQAIDADWGGDINPGPADISTALMSIGRMSPINAYFPMNGPIEYIALFNKRLSVEDYLRIQTDPWGELIERQAIHYALEIESGTSWDSAAYGCSHGYFRLVTDRPTYSGSDVDSVIPSGDQSAVKIYLSGTESIHTAFASGQLYAAGNGIFKAANTVPLVGSRFTVQDASDFTGGTLATAKGAAPAEGDLFEVTNAGSGTEAVKYVGVNRWYEDFITRDGMTNPSRSVDLELTGDYGTLSGFTFGVNCAVVAGTTTPFWSGLKANSVHLPNKKVRVYAVVDDSFYQIWSGIVDKIDVNETEFIVTCKSNVNAIHKEIPPETVESGTDIIPICIGDIIYSKIVSNNIDPVFIDLVIVSSISSKLAQASYLNYGYVGYVELKLRTTGKTFSEDALVGKYLFIDSGGDTAGDDLGFTKPEIGSGQLIYHNSATDGSGDTLIKVKYHINGFVVATHGYGGSASEIDKWNFKICDISKTGTISNGAIKELKENGYGKSQIFYYYKSQYDEINQVAIGISIDSKNINYGLPTINTDGTFSYVSKISIDSISYAGAEYAHGGGDWVFNFSGDVTKLIDDLFNTEPYHFEMEIIKSINVWFDIMISEDLSKYDNVYLCVDFGISNFDGGTLDHEAYTISLDGVNQYNVPLVNIFTYTPPSWLEQQPFGGYYVPAEYYGDSYPTNWELQHFHSILKESLLISSDNEKLIELGGIGKTLRAKISIASSDYELDWDMYLYKISLITIKSIDIKGNDIYTRISGEVLSDGTTESNTVYKALRLILLTYDGLTASDIDYGNLAASRDDWYVGRQLTEKKSAADYIKELCQQSFVAAYQNRKGKLAFSAWLDRTDAPKYHDNTNIIRDSIKNWSTVSMDKVYDQFSLNFSFDPGGDKYFSSYQIKDVDNISKRPTGDLQSLWDTCRAAYLERLSVNEFSMDLSYFIDRALWYNADDTGKVGLTTSGSAYKFLAKAVGWIGKEKNEVEYNLPMNAENIILELCDPVAFRDTIYTNAAVETDYYGGNIYEIEYDIKTDQIIVKPILDPSNLITEES